MDMQNEKYLTYYAPAELADCLDGLMRHHGASLQLERPGALPLPVILQEAEGDGLLVDISSVREVAQELRQGAQFRLLGQKDDRMLRSGPLQVDDCQEVEGRLLCACPRPDMFQVLQRREDFRAEVRLGLDCEVLVDGGEHGAWDGQLRDLSMSGCLVELPLSAAAMLANAAHGVKLELYFPNGTCFAIEGQLRHEMCDLDQRFLRAGFKFSSTTSQQDRELWFFVREIERELVRNAAGEHSALSPSPLFVAAPGRPAPRRVGLRRRGEEYPTPMSRSLCGVAEFLNTQILALRTGANVDAAQLSRHAERLLLMLEQSREALLFATVCLWQEPPLVRHCLAVAVRLADLAGDSMPRELRKAMLAAAMVHDLGKALVPPGLLCADKLSLAERRQVREHVALLQPRLASCSWLPREILLPVVEQVNERLDGSGYPLRLEGEDLRELARMTAVVDVTDALARQRPDRPALSLAAAQEQVLADPLRFDPRWAKRQIQHFGVYPIGSLLRYRGGELAWVLELDGASRPSLVRLTTQGGPPRVGTLGELREGEALAALGEPLEALPVA